MAMKENQKFDILLIPGFMCDHRLWDDMVPELSLFGNVHFGDLSEGETIQEMAELVLINAPETFILIGFSMGGYVAREIYKLAPNKVNLLALLNTSARGSNDKDRARSKKTINVIKNRMFRGLSATSLKQAFHPNRENDTIIFSRVQAMAADLGKDVFMRQIRLDRECGILSLRKILCPTLILTSDNDRLRSIEESHELAREIPNARLQLIDKCGHMTPIEKPKHLTEVLLNWIKETGDQ